jgi:flavorubredoxin
MKKFLQNIVKLKKISTIKDFRFESFLESQRDYHKSVIFLEFQFIEEQLKKNKQKTSSICPLHRI